MSQGISEYIVLFAGFYIALYNADVPVVLFFQRIYIQNLIVKGIYNSYQFQDNSRFLVLYQNQVVFLNYQQ